MLLMIASKIHNTSKLEESTIEELISVHRPLMSELINIVTYVSSLDKQEQDPLEVLLTLSQCMSLEISQPDIESLIGHLDAYQAKGLSFLLVQKPDAILYAPVFREMLRIGLRKNSISDLEKVISASIEQLQADINHRHSTG